MIEGAILELTPREMKEIHLSLIYARDFHHGTAGHNSYMILAKLANAAGFVLDAEGWKVELPKNVDIVEEFKRANPGL